MPLQIRHIELDDAMLRIGATAGLPAALESLGLDAHQLFSEVNIDLELFDNPDNLISVNARSRLINHCAARAQCAHLGLLVGAYSGLQSLGSVGLLTKNSPDVNTALNNLIRYFHIHNPGASLSLRVEEGIAILGYHVDQVSGDSHAQVFDGAVAIMFTVLNELCGPNWKPREAWFTHPSPKNTEAFQQYFHTHLVFNAEQNAIVFLASWLKRPVDNAHPELYKLVKNQIQAMGHTRHQEFLEQVRTVVRAAILRGNHKATYVASLFSMHPRTFNRRLKTYGIGYQELVDETMFTLARQMLNESNSPVSAIAVNLGYADARSFIRSFQRWSGDTPAHWRAAQKLQYEAETTERLP